MTFSAHCHAQKKVDNGKKGRQYNQNACLLCGNSKKVCVKEDSTKLNANLCRYWKSLHVSPANWDISEIFRGTMAIATSATANVPQVGG